MNTIQFEDVFGYSKWLECIKNLTVANDKLGDNLEGTSSRVKKSLSEQLALLEQYAKQIESLQKAGNIVGIAPDFQKTYEAVKSNKKILQDNKSIVDENNEVIQLMQKRLAELRAEYGKLDLAQKEDQRRAKEISRELTQTTKSVNGLIVATDLAGRSVKGAEGSFNAFKQQTRDLKRQLDGLPNAYDKITGKINEQNRAAVALNEQYQKNIKSINDIKRNQKDFTPNVGNYPQVSNNKGSGLSTVGAFAAGAVGIGSASILADKILSGIKSAGEIILQFDSLDSALQVVSNDTALFTQRQIMLQRVSDDLGQDLSVVEKTYTNLTASSKGTRLEGEATDKIFTAVTGTMGRLKKSGEDTEGALLAIGQMMSKGTIQSEELRGQLGERIPGAFNIMARALGVTTSKLGDMLKNGEVLASQALPKFAIELERTFNPNREKRVEGLTANLARLRNEGVEWVKGLNIGDTAGNFIGYITSMSRSVRLFFSSSVEESSRKLAEQTEKVNQLESTLPSLLSRYDELKSKSKLSADEQKELQTVVNDLANIAPSAATGFDAYGNALDVNKSKVVGFAQAQRELNAELNKAAIQALRDQTTGQMQRAQQTQNTLNRGTKQRSFNLKPFLLMSAEERRQATTKDAGKRREVALSDDDQRDLAGSLQKENKAIELSILQRLQLGDKLTQADKLYIDEGANVNLKRYKVIEDYNSKIAELDTKQAELFIKGDRDSLKKREDVLKDLKTYQDKKQAILFPSLTSKKDAVDEPTAKKAKDEETVLEKIDKQIKSIEATLQKQAMRDLKAGRIIDVDPKLVEKVQKLKLEYEAIRAMQEAVENGTYGKKIATPNKLTTSDLDRLGERPYVSYRLDDKGRQMSGSDITEADAKRTAQLEENLKDQSNIMALYYVKRKRLEYDLNNSLSGLDQNRQKQYLDLLNQIELAERAKDKDKVQRLKEEYAQMTEEDRAYFSRKAEIQEKYIQAGTTLVNGLFEIEQQKNQNRLTALEASKQAELDAVGDNEGAKVAIEKKYDQQRKQIQHQQDVSARTQALFNVGISTAEAIMKVYATLPPPAGTPLAIATGVLGLAQAAIIMAKPLPQYFTGKNIDGITNDNYSGPALVGDRYGRELWQHDGKMELVNKPTIVNVGKDDVIYPNAMTEQILQSNAIVGQINRQTMANHRLTQGRDEYQVRQLSGAINWDNFPVKRLADAIGEANEKLPFNMTTFDERGVLNWFIKANQRTLDHSRKRDLNWTKVNGEWRKR